MVLPPLRWLAKNVGSLLLALILAVIVWASAVVTADPNEKQTYRPVAIERMGQDANLVLVGEAPNQVYLTLVAPRSIWNQLNSNPDLVHAWVDLSGLEAGEHNVEVRVRIEASPVRLVQLDPEQIHLTLEPLMSNEFPIRYIVNGELPLGYKLGVEELVPPSVVVSGPKSAVMKVAEVRAVLDITGLIDTIKKTVPLMVLDTNGNIVANVTLTPKTTLVTQPISLLGGFKNVVVKVVTRGQVANGYRLTNISVSPPIVTLFSNDPNLVNDFPGFVDTLPVDLTGLTDDIEVNARLNLPEGISLVRESGVLVQVSVAAIESSLTLSLPIEVIGLAPELLAEVSPASVDVIISGPLNVLENLDPSSFRVVVDLSGLPEGIYQRTPVVDLVPEDVSVETTLPKTVEVSIELAPTPTITATVPVTSTSSVPLIAPTVTPKP